MRLKDKGRVTLPAKIRKALALEKGAVTLRGAPPEITLISITPLRIIGNGRGRTGDKEDEERTPRFAEEGRFDAGGKAINPGYDN